MIANPSSGAITIMFSIQFAVYSNWNFFFIKHMLLQVDFVREIKDIYEQSFHKYVETLSSQELNDFSTAIENAFLSLDNDLSEEALNNENMRTMAVAMSGKFK